MEVLRNPKVMETINSYPAVVQQRLLALRKLILEVANQIDGLDALEETLKWGEPSYLAKHGSTIRIDWKPKKPEQFAIYFKCTSKLVETFKIVHKNTFRYEGKRALIFKLDENIPKEPLKECIKMALTYHKIKHLPRLGA